MDSITFAKALAERLAEVLPLGFAARAVGDGVWLDTPDGLGTFGWAGAVDRNPADLDLYPEAAWVVMNSIQDGVCLTIRDVWPLLDALGHQLAMPGAKLDGTVLRMWFGDEHAPAVQLRSIELSQ